MKSKLRVLGEKIHNAMVKYGRFGEELGGSCAVCSYLFLTEAKRRYGLNLQFKAVHEHAWTEYHGVIYDLTATQFQEKPKVLIVDRDSLDEVVTSGNLRQLYQTDARILLDWINKEWPYYQQPQNYKIRWINQHGAKIVYKEKSSYF
jgi:hypothetical protein